jgi:hypothetical protein
VILKIKEQNMKQARVLLFSLIFCFTSGYLSAKENRSDKDFQLHVIGSNLGSGLSAGIHLNKRILLGVDSYSVAVEEEKEDKTEKIELDFRTTKISAKFFPFEDSAFFLQGGFVYRDWEVIGHFYDSNQDGTVTANEYVKITVTFPDAATMAGIGALWIYDSGFSLALGAGAISGGTPDVKIEAESAAQSDIDREETRIKDDMEQYKTVGIGYISLGFTF